MKGHQKNYKSISKYSEIRRLEVLRKRHSASFLLKNLNPINSQTIESEIQEYLQTLYQLSPPIKPFIYEEVIHQTIKYEKL